MKVFNNQLSIHTESTNEKPKIMIPPTLATSPGGRTTASKHDMTSDLRLPKFASWFYLNALINFIDCFDGKLY